MATAKHSYLSQPELKGIGRLLGALRPARMATVRGAEVFKAGVHRGETYTVADLSAMVKNFAAGRGVVDVPLVVGHEEQQPLDNTGWPAFGWVTRLYRRGDTLFADFERIPKSIAKVINARGYRKVSAEVYDEPPEGAPPGCRGRMLRRVALLGGELPQIKTLADLPYAEYAEGERPDACRPWRIVGVASFCQEGENAGLPGPCPGPEEEGPDEPDDRDVDEVLEEDLGLRVDRSDAQALQGLDRTDALRSQSTKPVARRRLGVGAIQGADEIEDAEPIDDPDGVPPLIVGPDGDLIDGHHRLAGLIAGGQDEANVIVATEEDLEAARELGGLRGRGSWSEEFWVRWMLARAGGGFSEKAPPRAGAAGLDRRSIRSFASAESFRVKQSPAGRVTYFAEGADVTTKFADDGLEAIADAAIQAKWPEMPPDFVASLTPDQLEMLAPALGGAPPEEEPLPEEGTMPMQDEPMPDAGGVGGFAWPEGMSREQVVAELVAMGQDQAALDAMGDEELWSLYQQLKGEPMAETNGTVAPPVQDPRAPKQVTLKYAEVQAIRREMDALKRDVKAERAARQVRTREERLHAIRKFCERMVEAGKLTPAEAEFSKDGQPIGQVAKILWMSDGVKKFSDGKTALDQAMAYFEGRPARKYGERIPDPVSGQGGREKLSEERRRELLGHTELGRTILRQEAKRN
jgi:hypothetical protein